LAVINHLNIASIEQLHEKADRITSLSPVQNEIFDECHTAFGDQLVIVGLLFR